MNIFGLDIRKKRSNKDNIEIDNIKKISNDLFDKLISLSTLFTESSKNINDIYNSRINKCLHIDENIELYDTFMKYNESLLSDKYVREVFIKFADKYYKTIESISNDIVELNKNSEDRVNELYRILEDNMGVDKDKVIEILEDNDYDTSNIDKCLFHINEDDECDFYDDNDACVDHESKRLDDLIETIGDEEYTLDEIHHYYMNYDPYLTKRVFQIMEDIDVLHHMLFDIKKVVTSESINARSNYDYIKYRKYGKTDPYNLDRSINFSISYLPKGINK